MPHKITILFVFLLTTCLALGLTEAVGDEGINAYAVHQEGITGVAVNIGLLSAGNVRDSHIAFERENGPAVTNYDFTQSGLSRSSHDTEMAGIILSAGSPSHPAQIGVAPGATLHSARFSNKHLYPSKVAQALDALIKNNHCRIIMTGIQLPKEIVAADGSSNWSKLYDYYAETYDVIFASAAGNSSPVVTVFGDVHNGITTAGMVKSDPNGIFDTIGSISNPGPTADGRKKPEIAAPTQGLTAPTSSGDDHWKILDPGGRGLTSYAIPHTAGVAALLMETAAKSSTLNDDKTEVIKAVIVNSAEQTDFTADSPIGSLSDSTSAWEPASGYGKLNALGAYQTLTAAPIAKGTSVSQIKGWAYDIMDKENVHTYKIQGTKGLRLVVTVTWHRKLRKVGNNYLGQANRFYLDLKIVSSSGKSLIFETAGRNNLIKTDLFLEDDDEYSIVLKNPTTAINHDYGLAFELIQAGKSPPRKL
jgi:hypothetical protein